MSESTCIPDLNGNLCWYLKGTDSDIIHREDGPAIEYNGGSKEWYINGKLHRDDGPAVEFSNGIKLWYYNGKKINCNSQEEFESLLKLRAFW